MSSRKVSTSSAALREHVAKAKAARASSAGARQTSTEPRKTSSSSGALQEQIAKAKEAARRAPAAAHRPVPSLTENEHAIVPDPAEMAEFDFGLDADPFHQRPRDGKSVLRKRVHGARADGRLNIAALGLAKMPDEVLNMYKYDAESGVAWGEVVDLTALVAADNNLDVLPDAMFPDIDPDHALNEDDDGPQFGGLQALDLHGNVLQTIPVGLRRLPQLTRLNLVSRSFSAEHADNRPGAQST